MKSWIRSLALCGCIAAGAVLPLSEAEAALKAYLKIKGERQGVIKGSVTQAGREDAIEVWGMSHEILSPRDAASGLPTGKRQHKPFVVTKPVDKSSPILYAVLTNNENLPEFQLDVYGANRKGAQSVQYTIKLKNASISSIHLTTDADGNLREHVSFTYQKIEWTWADGKTTAQDDWSSTTVRKRARK